MDDITIICPVPPLDQVLSLTNNGCALVFDLRPERDETLNNALIEYFWLRPGRDETGTAAVCSTIGKVLRAWGQWWKGARRVFFLADDQEYAEQVAAMMARDPHTNTSILVEGNDV
jgi:hypothetical protein